MKDRWSNVDQSPIAGLPAFVTKHKPVDTTEALERAKRECGHVKRIKIIGCSDSMMWYAALIGFECDLLADEGSVYRTREPAGYINFVLKQDAEVV